MSRLIRFRVWWLGHDGERVGSTIVDRFDLTAAITFAANRIGREDAHGFFVEKDRGES